MSQDAPDLNKSMMDDAGRATKSSIRDVVISGIQRVAREQKKRLGLLTDDLLLLESGLNSLCLAVLVARLDDELECDPFNGAEVPFPVTLGDVIRLYEDAAG